MEEKLTEKQVAFVQKELDLTEEEFFTRKEMDREGLIDECAAIEAEETVRAGDGDLSQRGVMAVELVDLIHGPYSWDEE